MKDISNKVSSNGNIPYQKNMEDYNICILQGDDTHQANEMNKTEKIQHISEKFAEIMEIMGLDLNNDSLKDTPVRVAKMYINEIFSGLDSKNKPGIKVFKNTYDYKSPLIELNIPFTSFCEHHFIPIQGKANIAYIPDEHVIGLSKLHRIVDYFARRPQVQERLTREIGLELKSALQTADVGVVLRATHSCISCRGVNHMGSSTITSDFSGKIAENSHVAEVLIRG